MKPKLINGASHSDQRGSLFYNNDFDASEIKRIYVIENKNSEVIRRWQGHKIEKRWFSAIAGSFKIELIEIDDWNTPSKDLAKINFTINAKELNVLFVPEGFVSSIQSLEENSKLLAMANFLLGESNDEYRFEIDYFGV